ncbi:hypothetical protein V6N13_043492 [Hibiscus sabdariffa]
MFLLRLRSWCNARWLTMDVSTVDLINGPRIFACLYSSIPNVSKSSWTPLVVDGLKFNTNEAVIGSFEECGIGGCLRNEKTKLLISFSKLDGKLDPTSAELLAISEDLNLLRNSKWVNTCSVVFESDCQIVVD